ncbi:cold-shock protein [Lacisediminihabitans sp. FW035]
MTSTGTVLSWFPEQGWGVIASADTAGGCWTHFSSLRMSGFRALAPGAVVEFEYESFAQDGYGYRALEVVPHGAPPVTPDRTIDAPESAAYRSIITITPRES